MRRHAVPRVAQEIRGPTRAGNFIVRACRDGGKKRERGREGEKRGVGYATAVSSRGIRVLDSHPRSRDPPLLSSPPLLQRPLSRSLSLSFSLRRCNPPRPFQLPSCRASRQRCNVGLTRRENARCGVKGTEGNGCETPVRGEGGWLRHKPAIPARMTGDYVIRRDVRALIRAAFACPLARPIPPPGPPRDARFTNEPRPPGSNSPH